MISKLLFLMCWLCVLGFINRDNTPIGIYTCMVALGVIYLSEVLALLV